MQYRTLCDFRTSAIALGTMDFGGKIEETQAFDLLDAYREIGGNHIDTARMYGDFSRGIQGGSEAVIGKWIEQRACRDSILLATKGAFHGANNAPRLSRCDIFADMQMSLDALRTDHVDLYYLHRDDPGRDVRDILETLTALVEAGYTKYVGLSNWQPDRIRAILECGRAHGLIGISANQLQFSLARQIPVEDPTLVQMDDHSYHLHQETSMACVCFSAQAKGFLQKLALHGADGLPDKVRRRFYYPENIAVYHRAARMAEMCGTSIGAIALAYLTNQPFPCYPIAGVRNTDQLRDIAQAGNLVLTQAQLHDLRPDLV